MQLKRLAVPWIDHRIWRKTVLDFCDTFKEIEDPWYTRDFEKAYTDISLGVRGLLNYLILDNETSRGKYNQK